MNNFSFWNEWEKPFQVILKVLFSILSIFMVTFLIFELGDFSIFYKWKVTGYLENITFPIFSNHSILLESTITTDLPIIFQKVFGSFKDLPIYYTYIYLLVLYLGMAGCMTITTYLQKFWHLFSTLLFVVLLAVSGIGQVGLFGYHNQVAIIGVALIFLPLSYYFSSINESVRIGKRFLAFVIFFGALFCVILATSEYDSPLLHLARFSYLPAVLISIIFILAVGHEMIYAILMLTTPYSRGGSGNNAIHFIILTSVYLLNLFVLYLNKIDYLEWDIFYINQFVMITISSILGIWGLKSRELRYKSILPFAPYAIYLFLGMALITFSTFLFQSFNENDPFLEAIGNITLYSHIGFGSMFFLYVIGNFLNQLRQDLPVHQFVYQEDNFPYISARIAGAIIVAGLFFRMSYASFHLIAAGYYNGLGDFSLSTGNQGLANHYFTKSKSYSLANHHANYMLAQEELDINKKFRLIKKSNDKKSSAYNYVNLGRNYEENNQFFHAVFTYQDGLKQFPENWALQNNLALLYNRTHVVDSSLYYLKNNDLNGWQASIIDSNIGAVCATHQVPIKELISDDADLQRFPIQSNLIVNKLLVEDSISNVEFILTPKKRVLNLFTYSYLKNLGMNSYLNQDLNYINIIDPFLEEILNEPFYEELLLVHALNLYSTGRVADAFAIVTLFKNQDATYSGKWETLLGKWAMELGAPLLASKYFETARESSYPNASADLAQAYALFNNKSVAMHLINRELSADSLQTTNRSTLKSLLTAIEKDQLAWKKYSFENEERRLEESGSTPTEGAKILFERLGNDNPFFEKGVLVAAAYFENTDKDSEKAYKILLKAVTVNEYSGNLIKAYIIQSLKMGLVSYAESSVIRLIEILPLEEYEAYELEFEEMKILAKSKLDENW